MTDTVPVTVNLPKPLEGWEWGECPSGHCDGSHFSERRHTLRLHRVAPPECMAVEMLVSDVLVWAAGRTTPAIDQRAFNAARKAVAQGNSQPERMVMVELRERIVRFLSDHTQWHMLTGAEIGMVATAARKALSQQQVPSEDVCAIRGCDLPATCVLTGVGPLCDHHDSLITPKRKYVQQEVCGVPIRAATIVCHIIPKGHAGAHSPNKKLEVTHDGH